MTTVKIRGVCMPDQGSTVYGGTGSRGGAGPRLDERTQKTIFTGGGVLGAIVMSSCCIIPLALFSVGVTGAWIGNLAALYPYKIYFFVVTAGFLGAGFYKAYRKPTAAACEPASYCATATADRINRAVLWTATVLVLAALGFPYYAPWLLA